CQRRGRQHRQCRSQYDVFEHVVPRGLAFPWSCGKTSRLPGFGQAHHARAAGTSGKAGVSMAANVQDRKTNPLYNDRKLKLGTFGSNLDRGCAISTIDGVLEIDWPNTLTLAKLADEMEFEALVPVGRWKGFGGVTNFNGPGFECLSWAAGIG